MILVKVADISNECRPMEVSEPWLECLLQEFFNQVNDDGSGGLIVFLFLCFCFSVFFLWLRFRLVMGSKVEELSFWMDVGLCVCVCVTVCACMHICVCV